MDFPHNQGGQFWDLGIGINARVPSGRLVGNHFAFEWLQPLRDDFNGYQLERQGPYPQRGIIVFDGDETLSIYI